MNEIFIFLECDIKKSFQIFINIYEPKKKDGWFQIFLITCNFKFSIEAKLNSCKK